MARENRERWRPFWRYVLWQAPSWMAVALALAWLVAAFGLSPWIGLAALAAYVAKDFALYPVMRATFRTAGPVPPVGQVAEAVERLAPAGYVRVNAELWKAEARGGEVPAGARVRVLDARGLTLIVERPAAPPG
jgi:membrane-bound ClpP family serine protease